ncbi:MAG: ClC family H(+)/Cl(-) exchange transporter [Deltaproteobacteria bacterium]|nr:ClC family H(+)/Cl(-) exchange transporter [Deltaproteobacteria bacterium]
MHTTTPASPPDEPAEQEDWRDPLGLLRISTVAAVAGVLVGAIGGGFRWLLLGADEYRMSLLHWAHAWSGPGWVVPLVLVTVCTALARLIVVYVPRVSGSGIQDVEAVWRGDIPATTWEVLPAKFIGGLLAIGSGLVLGREGPTVHLGAAIGSESGRRLHLGERDMRILQTALGGAGLGVAFNAPLGAALFVFEEVTKSIRLRLGLVTLIGTSTAIVASRFILGNRPDFNVEPIATPDGWTIVVFLLFGLLTGVVGVFYNRLVLFFLELSDRMSRVPPLLKSGAIGLVVGALLWFDPMVATGGGNGLTQDILGGGVVLSAAAVYLVVRFFLGPLSYATQTPGGLFAPLLAVGALWGALVHGLASGLLPGPGTTVAAFAIVGMSTFFAAVVRAPLTGIVLIFEMTATTTLIIPMMAAAVGAVLAALLLGNPPIYDSLRERMMSTTWCRSRTPEHRAGAKGGSAGTPPK